MPSRVIVLLALVLATATAFTDGGSSDAARAGFLAGALVILAASLALPVRLVPARNAERALLGGLAGLAVLTAISGSWAPDPGGWDRACQLALAYFALTWAIVRAVSADREAADLVAPGLAAGAVIVLSYALLGRALPDLITADASARAGGRLFAPIGYWNATGLLAALGLVAGAAVVAAGHAPRRLFAAAAPLLGAAIALSYSRTAIAAAAAGLLAVALLDRRRSTLAAAGSAATAALAGAATTLPFPAVGDGTVTDAGAPLWLALLLAVCGLSALAAGRLARPGPAPLRDRTRRLLTAMLVLTCLTPIVVALASRQDSGAGSFGANAGRLTETGSNRAQYWQVALDTLADHPVAGAGAGSFETQWLQHRTIDEKVVNAHSLWLETAAELGVLGLLALGLAAGGSLAAARRPANATHAAAAGVAVAWTLGATVDWHWQIPAVTAPAMLALAVLVSGRRVPEPASAD